MTPGDSQKSNVLLENLAFLIGKWDLQLVFPSDPSTPVQAEATIDWLERGGFAVYRLGDSSWIIGPDDSTGEYSVLYHDGRGVSRVYQMSLDEKSWKMWRNSPGFSQRFHGNFNDDQSVIKALWEKSSDGDIWEHDFDLKYSRKT